MPDTGNLNLKNKFDTYPIEIKEKTLYLRSLILSSSNNNPREDIVTEC